MRADQMWKILIDAHERLSSVALTPFVIVQPSILFILPLPLEDYYSRSVPARDLVDVNIPLVKGSDRKLILRIWLTITLVDLLMNLMVALHVTSLFILNVP